MEAKRYDKHNNNNIDDSYNILYNNINIKQKKSKTNHISNIMGNIGGFIHNWINILTVEKMGKTIKVSDDVAEKIKEINQIRGDKSLNKTIESFLPQGTKTEEQFMQEPPAFTISNKIVSWNDLKKSKIGDKWTADNETATVIFKDEFGALVRFMFWNDVWVEYYHFI